MTRGELIDLALGADEVRKVDTAIPQGVFDAMTPTAREDIAGWYYDVNNRAMGRLLTQTECWRSVVDRVRRYELVATMSTSDDDLSFLLVQWPCFRYHAERDEIQIVTSDAYLARQQERHEARIRRAAASAPFPTIPAD